VAFAPPIARGVRAPDRYLCGPHCRPHPVRRRPRPVGVRVVGRHGTLPAIPRVTPVRATLWPTRLPAPRSARGGLSGTSSRRS
jgi:hypothetical protein